MAAMDKQQELRYQLSKLQLEHQDMDQSIENELRNPSPDQLLMQRYKRRKLQIKEQLLKIESELLPDIIA